MTFSPRLLAAAGVVLLCSASASAQSAILTKARAFLGKDDVLDAVKSVHYTGTLISTDTTDAAKETRATIDIIFQRPEQQRIVVTNDKIVETTALDGYEAWQRVQESDNPAKWRLAAMSVDQVKRLRASTWENLSFFRGIEKSGGKIEVMEPATVDGVACQKVAFIHAANIAFIRCFDQSTGRLVLTETENGSTIKEDGEMMADGIRFPKSIVTNSKNAAGKTSVTTIIFDKIQVNETFPPDLFAYPSLGK